MPDDPQTLTALEIARMAEKRRQSEILVKRLRRRSPLRQIAENALNGVPLSPEAIERLSAMTLQFSDSRWKERTVAAWALGEQKLPADQALNVALRLCRMLENRQVGALNRLVRRLSRAGVRTLICMAGFYFSQSLLFELFSVKSNEYDLAIVLLLLGILYGILGLGLPFIPFVSLSVDVRRNNVARTMAAWSLGRLGIPETVEALTKSAVKPSDAGAVSIEASRALERVLPHVGAEHYGQFGRQTVPNLCELLLYGPGIQPLWLKILGALEKIGDARAIEPIERLIKYGENPGVTKPAERLLPILRERQRQENEPKILLRASSFEDVSGDTLLRAASSASVTAPQQLLRATIANEPGSE